MTARQDPMRLSVDPAASPRLRSLLAEARADVPDRTDLTRLSARIGAAITAGLPGPDLNPTPAGPSVGGAATSKVLVAGASLVVGAALVASGWFVWRAKGDAKPSPSHWMEGPSMAPSARVGEPTAASASETTAPTESGSSLPSAPRAREQHASGPTETALLDQARDSLERDPRRALALTEEHRRRFPSGALAQEREVIAIEALSRLGQTAEAKNRGSDFARRYPGSAHQQKVDQATRGQ